MSLGRKRRKGHRAAAYANVGVEQLLALQLDSVRDADIPDELAMLAGCLESGTAVRAGVVGGAERADDELAYVTKVTSSRLG